MGKFLKDNYYILVRMVLMLIYSMYGLSENMIQAGVPLRLLLLVALYISVMTVKELAEGWKKAALLAAAVIDNILLVVSGGAGFILLACFLGFEILSYLKAAIPVYFLIYLVMFADTPLGNLTEFMVITMLIVFYVQHEYVVAGYEKQMYEDTMKVLGEYVSET